MPNSNGAAGTQADPAAQPQAGEGTVPEGATQPQAGDAAAEGAGESISLEEAKKLRSESQQLRRRLKDLEAADEARTLAEKTELERALARAEKAEGDLASERTARQELALRAETAGIARRLGFRDPEIAHRLIAGEVEFGDDGAARNVERLLGDVAKAHPYLVNGTADFGGGPRGAPATGGNDMNTAIRRAAGRA